MKSTTEYRVKFLAIIVVMAFSWITIGSLVMFHQEHVLKKHVDLQTYLFVAPKNKDKTVHLKKYPQSSNQFDFSFGLSSSPGPGMDKSLHGSALVYHSDCVPLPKSLLPGSLALRAPPSC